ncbi:MAG: DUF2946 family protein [Burkholderiaceae bacterium]|jgi:hypothetical protein|nr:DUF2946 family protein [Burkholderiaceae bacterium]
MDEMVKKALAKWPAVPHCYGWLGLDARGDWYLRDARAQAAGAFGSGPVAARGSRLEHAGLIGFIKRNYAHDEAGQWFFQNGPQRVYVELQATPWIWRVALDGAVHSHTGIAAAVRQVHTDEQGRVYLQTSDGFGLVHTQDVLTVADALEAGRWPAPQPLLAHELPARFGYVPSPLALSVELLARNPSHD